MTSTFVQSALRRILQRFAARASGTEFSRFPNLTDQMRHQSTVNRYLYRIRVAVLLPAACTGSTLMMRPMLAALVLTFLAACTTSPPRDYVDPRPTPTVAQRAAFGTIGIAAAGVARPAAPNAPKPVSDRQRVGTVVGSGGGGAVLGAAEGLACGPLAIACVPVFAVVGGVVGLGIGTGFALSYPTEEEISGADITLRNALLSVDIENRLVETVLTQASQANSDKLWRVAYSIEANTWDLRHLEGEVDTRILITASKVALLAVNPDEVNQPGADPAVRLEIVVEGQVFEEGREAPSFERRWLYDSEVHDYLDWADDKGTLVIMELNRAIGVLGAQIVADFLAGRDQLKRSPPVEENLQAAVAAQDAGPAKEAAKPRKLRVAIFPFGSGIRSSDFAKNELAKYTHQFVARGRGMELIYSAHDDAFGHAAVAAGTSFWMGGDVSKTPNETNVYRTAEALDVDLVLTYFHQNRLAGWYSNDQYKFELYVFDVRQRRMYQGTGDQHSVREVLELIFSQIEIGRRAS